MSDKWLLLREFLKVTWHLLRDTNKQEAGQELLIDPFLPSCLIFYCLSPIFSLVSKGNEELCDCSAHISLSLKTGRFQPGVCVE